MIVVPNSQVRLLSDVPFHLNYEHVRTFESETEQYNYFISKPSQVFTNLTYQRENDSIKVPVGYDKLYPFNYMMYQNTEHGGKWFYAFITKKEYVNPDTTRIYFEIDVFQSWQFQIEWNPSYVVREHRTRWNPDGSPVVNTLDEGLNYGTEYETVSIQQYIPYEDVFFLVIVCTRRMDVNSKEIFPSLNGSPQPLSYYIHPFKMDGTIPPVTIDGIPQTLNNISDVLVNLYKQDDAVKNVVSLYVTEYPGFDVSYSGGVLALSMANFEPVNIQEPTTQENFVTLYVKNLPTYSVRSVTLGGKYDDFADVEESKLRMHPYTVTLLTDLKGNIQEIKNEFIDGSMLKINTLGSLGTSNKICYQVDGYLYPSTMANSSEVGIQNGIINNNPNDVPIITDLLSAYLQGNRNALEVQKSSSLFGTVTGVVGSALSRSPMGVVGSAGSGYFEMAGINARLKDIENTPPQITHMGGNTAFDYGNGIKGLYIIKKQITGEYRKKLTDFFKVFGYMINELKIPNLKTRSSYNYVKTSIAHIVGDIPQEGISQLKTMFNNGVTLWHGDFVGDYSRVNDEV